MPSMLSPATNAPLESTTWNRTLSGDRQIATARSHGGRPGQARLCAPSQFCWPHAQPQCGLLEVEPDPLRAVQFFEDVRGFAEKITQLITPQAADR
jgi:hypothetical protein